LLQNLSQSLASIKNINNYNSNTFEVANNKHITTTTKNNKNKYTITDDSGWQ
jgi:hypothetical protein